MNMCHGLGALQVHRQYLMLYDTYELYFGCNEYFDPLTFVFLSIGNANDQKHGNTKWCLVFGTYP